jgi:hypothetical protein
MVFMSGAGRGLPHFVRAKSGASCGLRSGHRVIHLIPNQVSTNSTSALMRRASQVSSASNHSFANSRSVFPTSQQRSFGALSASYKPLPSLDQKVVSSFSPEDVQQLKHFIAVKKQAAEFLSISPSQLDGNLTKIAARNPLPQVQSGLVLTEDFKAKFGEKQALNATQKEFLDDCKKILITFEQLDMAGSESLKDNAKSKLTDFFIKYSGNSDRIKDLSIQDLKAIIEQDFSVIVKMQEPKGKSYYNKERFHHYRTTYQGPFIRKIVEMALGMGLFTFAAKQVTEALKSDEQKNKETKKSIKEAVKIELGSFESSVKERKDAEQELRKVQNTIEFYENPANVDKVSQIEFVHLIEKLDKDFVIKNPIEVIKELKGAHAKVVPLRKEAQDKLKEVDTFQKTIQDRLKKNPKILEKYVDDHVKKEFKEKGKATHSMLGNETLEFQNEKKKIAGLVKRLIDESNNLNIDGDYASGIPETYDTYPISESHTFANEFNVKHEDVVIGANQFAQLHATAGASDEVSLTSIGREENAELNELKSRYYTFAVSDNKDPEFSQKAQEVKSLIQRLEKHSESERSRAASINQELSQANIHLAKLQGAVREEILEQRILPVLKKDSTDSIKEIAEMGELDQFQALEKEFQRRFETEDKLKQHVASVLKISMDENKRSPGEKALAKKYINQMTNYLSVRDVGIRLNYPKYIEREESNLKRCKESISNSEARYKVLLELSKRLEPPTIL